MMEDEEVAEVVDEEGVEVKEAQEPGASLRLRVIKLHLTECKEVPL